MLFMASIGRIPWTSPKDLGSIPSELLLYWRLTLLSCVFCTAGIAGEVPHQSHLHLPSDQCLWGGRIPHAGHVLLWRRSSHRQLPDPELAQVGRCSRQGGPHTGIWTARHAFYLSGIALNADLLHSFFVVPFPGLQQPMQGLPTALRSASSRDRWNRNGSEPEHSAFQSGNLCQNQQRQSESTLNLNNITFHCCR